MANQKQMRTQILITDIPSGKFTSKWPTQLEKTLFKEQFPNLQSHLQYYTPLPFLNRIIIIFDNEDGRGDEEEDETKVFCSDL